MKYIGIAFVGAVLLVVAVVMATIQPMIPGMVQGAADMLAFTVRACLGTAILVIAAVGAWFLLRQQYERDRQRDGAYALREYHTEPWTRRLLNVLTGKPSPKVILDANAMLTHAAMIYRGVHLAEPPAGWDRQLAYLGDVERTRRVQAALPGDSVLGNPLVNLQRGVNGFANAATARFAAGNYDKPIRTSTFVDPIAPEPARLPAPELTGMDAVEQSSPASIVMGQTADGALVRWNMAQTPHLRYHGMTQGSGKTNAIQTVAAGALATGAHLVICDRVQFKDWGDFDGRAELVDTSDPAQLAAACLRLYNIYLGRTLMLKQAGAKNIAQHGKMQRIVVVISEFGAQLADARADGIGREVEYPLKQLARLAGSTGIHIVAEDQAVEQWPRPLIANLSPAIGKMPDHAGQACGYHGRGGGTGSFPSYTFWYEGATFSTPHMEPDLPAIMATVPPPQALVMLTPPAAIPGEDVSVSVSNTAESGVFSGVSGVSQEKNTVTPPPPAPVSAGNTDPNKWDEFILEYMAKHPELWQTPPRGVRELARAMSRHETGNESSEDSYVSIASKTTKRIRGEAYLPNGSKLDTDTTGGEL